MGNTESTVDGRVTPKSFQDLIPEHHGDVNSHGLNSPLRTDFAQFEALRTQDGRNQQDLRQALHAELLAPTGSRFAQQDDLGHNGIDMATAISFIQQLKKTASPDDLIALRKCAFNPSPARHSNNLQNKLYYLQDLPPMGISMTRGTHLLTLGRRGT
jgi:hypothetical protein